MVRGGWWAGAGLTPSRARAPSTMDSTGTDRRAKVSTRRLGRKARSAVVLIKSLEGGVPNGEIMRRVREGISPKDFNINNVRFRDAVSGGVLLEILDSDTTPNKVDALAGAISSILSDCASVSRPIRKAEFRVKGFDHSTTAEELREIVAKAGGCCGTNVAVSEIRQLSSGHRAAWVSCPVAVARSIAEVGHLKVGWTSALVDFAQVKRQQCYRCWEYGHVRGTCKAAVDRAGRCFRCGEEGHKVEACKNGLTCAVCKDKGLDSNHRVGSRQCGGVDPIPTRGRT